MDHKTSLLGQFECLQDGECNEVRLPCKIKSHSGESLQGVSYEKQT